MGAPLSAPASTLTIRVQNAVVVDSPRGRCFGTCTAVAGDRITVVTHGRLRVGERMPLRMELTESGVAVVGHFEVCSVERGAADAPLVVEGVFEREEGTGVVVRMVPRTRAPIDEPTTHGGFRAPRPRPGRTGEASARRAPATRPSVAGAVRAAVAGLRVQTSRVSGPMARVRLSQDRTGLLIRWRTWPDAAVDWERQLQQGRLTLHVPRSPRRDAVLTVHLVMPDGRSLRCEGVVQTRVLHAFTVVFSWTAEQRRTLEQALG